jgi:predicted lipase
VKRESRKAEWEAFIRDMGEKCARVDQTFTQRETELREHYTDLEKKLHLQVIPRSNYLYIVGIRTKTVATLKSY